MSSRVARSALAFAFALASLAACAARQPGVAGAEAAEDEAPKLQSNDIMARDPVTGTASVKHVLISWQGLREDLSEVAQVRTREQADALAVKVLERVRAGEPIEPIMKALSDDPGSADSGEAYEVTADAGYVFEFKRMALRLEVDEAGLVLSSFGWHIMKRVD